MGKAKFRGFAIACILGCLSLSPVYAFAAETNSESVTLSDNKDQNQRDRKAAFDDAMKRATDKWNALSDKQKAEVYALIEDEMKAEMRLMDKLVEFDIISKEDASAFKAHMMNKFNKLRESGQFPLTRQKNSKRQ